MELDDLISQVHEAAVTEEPLDRLSAAMDVKADLDDLADTLIGHFVDGAREAGCSWTEIGSAMGVTKQAAQQRHTSDRRYRDRDRDRGRQWRFKRFTPRARTVAREANEAAAQLGHSYIGTEHLLLGLLAVPQGIAGRVLAEDGITRDGIIESLERGSEPVESGRRHRRPFTPLAKQALERSLANALRLGHNYVGTEHLLLGTFDVSDGLAAKHLLAHDLTKASVEAQMIEMLTGKSAS